MNIPPGFKISVIAVLPEARFMAVAPNGDILVSQPGFGKITLLRPAPGGEVSQSFTFASGLRKPHEMVFHTVNGTSYLYVAESHQIDRFSYLSGDTAAHDREVIITSLPDRSTPELGGAYAHELKNIAMGSDDRLYVTSPSPPVAMSAPRTRPAIRFVEPFTNTMPTARAHGSLPEV